MVGPRVADSSGHWRNRPATPMAAMAAPPSRTSRRVAAKYSARPSCPVCSLVATGRAVPEKVVGPPAGRSGRPPRGRPLRLTVLRLGGGGCLLLTPGAAGWDHCPNRRGSPPPMTPFGVRFCPPVSQDEPGRGRHGLRGHAGTGRL